MKPELFWLALTATMTGLLAFAAALYFWCRLGHYLALTLGVPYLRTLIWTASWVAQMIFAWQLLAR